MADMIKEPPHYANNKIEPIDYIVSNKLDFCEGNVVKYITRYKQKGGIDDLLKCKQYVQFIIDKYDTPQTHNNQGGTKLTPTGY